MCAVAFDLLIGGDGAEDDFGELTAFEGAVGDASGGGVVSPRLFRLPLSAADLTGLDGRTLVPPKDASQSPY